MANEFEERATLQFRSCLKEIIVYFRPITTTVVEHYGSLRKLTFREAKTRSDVSEPIKNDTTKNNMKSSKIYIEDKSL